MARTTGDGGPSFLPYLNLNQGVRITYPPGWVSQEQSAPSGFVVGFLSPQEDPSDPFRENLNLFIEKLPLGVTLEGYAQGCLQGLNQMSAMNQTPIRFLENGSATLAGRPAYRHVYTGALQPVFPLSGKRMQYLTVANAKGYVVTYTAQLEKFDKFLPVIQQMIDSLEIK